MTTIRVGAAPKPFEGRGLFFDGQSATPKEVDLGIDEARGRLAMMWEGAEPVLWPLAEIRALRDGADKDIMILRHTADPLARLVLSTDEERRIMTARAANLKKAPPIERKWRLVTWSLAALASVAVMVTVLIPLLANTLAGYIPPAGERALGDATLSQIRNVMDQSALEPLPFCEAQDGADALAAMGARLFPNGTEPEVTVYVLDHEMINAFALPGGIVVFFRGLLEAAETPEEVAAVYAHEVGHVVARDPTRIALRSAGSIGVLGLLFGDFAGGAMILFLTERIIQAHYSQEAEAAADAYAHGVMAEAGLPPDAMASFFERLRAEHGDAPGIVQHFMAHPEMADRIEAARAATPEDISGPPVLDDAQWAALRAICSSGSS